MPQKILILGANGMLGHDLAKAFADQQPILWDQANLDITNGSEVTMKISQLKPTLVINAAAYTDVDGAEKNEEFAMAVNGKAVGYLAQTCQTLGAILVHFSTEYVFSGDHAGGYNETDQPAPLNAYGRSKALGERLLQKDCEMFYLIRSSWLYGQALQAGKPRGLNFVQTMLKLASEGKEIKVVSDQFGKPTYAKDLAAKTRAIIDGQKPCGVYHITNEGVCSWYELAEKVFALKKIKADLQPINSLNYPAKTLRPKYGILNNTKLEPLRSWEEALAEYLV
jgi:dTDP-4-dehydrorhamnose reductase